jgi:pimeloyl-ACP methyl ester carboxylesterase
VSITNGAPATPFGGPPTIQQVSGVAAAMNVGGMISITSNALAPGLHDLTLTQTGTGWVEDFLLYIPILPTPNVTPLLTVFHQFSVSHRDVLLNTSFLQEAQTRGWFMLAPKGATDINFSSLVSQANTESVLRWVLTNYNIDRSRVYGVGFSMGGGNALSYAARHLDPFGPMFAAVVNLNGSLSISDVYVNEIGTHWALNFLYGGNPTAEPFAYSRCSVLEIDQATGFVIPERSNAWNLAHIPIETWYAIDDPLVYLVEENLMLHAFLNGLGGVHILNPVLGAEHTWDSIDETQACNFLQQHTLAMPTSGYTVADRDGTYFQFEVEQDQAGDFSPMDWSVVSSQNTLIIDKTRNIRRITVDTTTLGLDSTQPLTVILGTADGQPDEIILGGYTQSPQNVTRNGVPNTSWVYDSSAGTLEIHEINTGYHTWITTP